MRIVNYDNRSRDLSDHTVRALRKEGRNEWYVRGACDGFSGERVRAPRLAAFRVRATSQGRFDIIGKTYEFRDHLKRLGGRWQSSTKSWSFPTDALGNLKSDPDLNAATDLWSGFSEEDSAMKQAMTEYGSGYERGQQAAVRVPLGPVKY